MTETHEKRTETHARDLINRQAAIQTAERMCKRCDTSSIEDYHDLMVEALTALPSALRDLDEIQMEIYVSGYEKGAEESLAEVLNAFKKVRDELPEDKREEYTDDFCKIMGRMLDELEKKE